MDKQLLITSSPHMLDTSSTRNIMAKVLIALMPSLAASVYIFGVRALILTLVTVAACVGFEFGYCKLMKKDVLIGDLSAVVTGVLLAFNMPVDLSYGMAIVGALVAIIVVKQLFGGLGYNFVNPAIVGRIVLAVSFAAGMTTFAFPANGIDALAGATPLVALGEGAEIPLMTLLLGNHGGVLGETCALAIIIGGIYLIATKVISPAIPVAYLGTVAAFALVTGRDPIAQLLSGGLLLGAFFMATDYVTSPFTLKGKIVFGVGLGVITCAIRFYGSMAEGVSYAILLMNLFVPYINNWTRQKPLGGAKK